MSCSTLIVPRHRPRRFCGPTLLTLPAATAQEHGHRASDESHDHAEHGTGDADHGE